MLNALLKFNELPSIGFAHHFYTDKYCFKYSNTHKSFEIVYVKSGCIELNLYDEKLYAPEGSILVLFRHLPITLSAVNTPHQAHCTVQVEFDYNFEIVKEIISEGVNKLILPFVTPPCPENEKIKKILYSIISDIGISRQEYSFSSSLKFLDIMIELDRLARKNICTKEPSASNLVHKIKKFITDNINKPISLSDISNELSLTSSYINHVFKENEGLPINQYINNKKVLCITELISTQHISFRTACNNVGINDYSYGYRLFKKHTGTTPGMFLKSNIFTVDEDEE